MVPMEGYNRTSTGYNRASTGIDGLDTVVDGLRLGDSVVWQVDNTPQMKALVTPFVARARLEGRDIIYLRYGDHEPLIDDLAGVEVHRLDPEILFESFASQVHEIITGIGYGAFYVFDSLTSLLYTWRSDLAVGNFFSVTAAALFESDSLSYFGLRRSDHTFSTLAMIRDATTMLIDIYQVEDNLYLHPLKVWLRHSPTMFFPHLMDGPTISPVTSSRTNAKLMAEAAKRVNPPDHWQRMIERGQEALGLDEASQRRVADELLDMFIGRGGRVVDLCRAHLDLADLLSIAQREVGTGFIGGKSVGMLVARAILEHDPEQRFAGRLEGHDSYFLGSDLFYTFIIANGWWKLWMEQKSPVGYFTAGASLHNKLPTGRFPPAVREQFMEMLNYFGTAPIIVRSSSLLEDNFGNAFAGKYESVFCANQGNAEQRLHALEDAVRRVYASAMNQDALQYRRNRGLDQVDEQMAILVQRVSGAQYGDYFFPHAAGVGNSNNLYIWDPSMDPDAGMLRLVVGLGTRAVDRTITDHARLVTLDDPFRRTHKADAARNTQRYIDALSLPANRLTTIPVTEVSGLDIGTDWGYFLSTDTETLRWLRENNRPISQTPRIVDFDGLLKRTDLAELMSNVFTALSTAYDHPVDIEYTVNLDDRGGLSINLVQCRPLQTRGLGRAVEMPQDVDPTRVLVATQGDFMGGNVRLPIDYVVLVRPEAYLRMGHQDRYQVARAMGAINKRLADRSFMIAAPGRWGTTTPSLGIPVHFTEVSNAAVMVEFTYSAGGFIPELSQGSHFFQDLVESGIFYLGVFDRHRQTIFHPDLITGQTNRLAGLVPAMAHLGDVLHVAKIPDLVLYSDIPTQRVICL